MDRIKNLDKEKIDGGTETEKPNSPANNPSVYSGVFLQSGEFTTGGVDMSIPGRGFDFLLARTYRSQSLYSGVLGWGWDHNYNKRLLEMYGGDIIYYDGSGRRERFKAIIEDDEITGYESPPGWFTELKRTADGNYRHISPDKTIEFFDANGKIVKIQDRLQNKMVFYYNLSGQLTTVMDTMGRLYDFEYYEFEFEEDENGVEDARVKITSGRLKSITDFSGRKVAYTYDTETGDLFQVDRNSGTLEGVKTLSRKTRYIYEPDAADLKLRHNLRKIIDPRGVVLGDSPVLTVHYTTEDIVEKQDFIELDRDIVFTITDGTTRVFDAKNNIKTYTIVDQHVKIFDDSVFETGFEYDPQGHGLVTLITYPKKNKTKYIYDLEKKSRRSRGNIRFVRNISAPDADDETTTIETIYTYHPDNNLVVCIGDPKGNNTYIVRNPNGNIKKTHIDEKSYHFYNYFED
ncbi:MAG: hypothetical protein GY757_15290, partial [bacterium]|nr:hypothetical protein [bacterium]